MRLLAHMWCGLDQHESGRTYWTRVVYLTSIQCSIANGPFGLSLGSLSDACNLQCCIIAIACMRCHSAVHTQNLHSANEREQIRALGPHRFPALKRLLLHVCHGAMSYLVYIRHGCGGPLKPCNVPARAAWTCSALKVKLLLFAS